MLVDDAHLVSVSSVFNHINCDLKHLGIAAEKRFIYSVKIQTLLKIRVNKNYSRDCCHSKCHSLYPFKFWGIKLLHKNCINRGVTNIIPPLAPFYPSQIIQSARFIVSAVCRDLLYRICTHREDLILNLSGLV